ncbi:holin [Streptomyces sp. NPDC008061]|uniref:holin n=1 Tax=Streptomyces sp. NPDC008061 TaxID=3364805 RepID=UPI0036ED882B
MGRGRPAEPRRLPALQQAAERPRRRLPRPPHLAHPVLLKGPQDVTAAFWHATAERAVRTAAQSLVAGLGLDTAGVLDVDWCQGLSLVGGAALLAVLTALATSATGEGPGVTETVRTAGDSGGWRSGRCRTG